jgi:hypothetical protein
MQIFDNYLPPDIHHNIKTILLSGDFPWFLNGTITHPTIDDDTFQFTHTFYRANDGITSQWCHHFNPIVEKLIIPGIILRIKANLNPRQVENAQLGQMHVDYTYDCKTAIYYVNTNDGYTKFETGEIIKSVENRLVVFDANCNHVGYTCTDEKVRVVVNFNYFNRP